MEKSTIALIGGIVVATAFAYAYGSRQGPAAPLPAPQPQQEPAAMMDPDPNGDPASTTELPPGHPPIGDMAQQGAAHDTPSVVAPSDDEPAALTWKAPASWTLVPNPNAMRLATYKVSDSELIVARAGGDVDGNVKRWAGQFDESYSLRESHKTVHGLKVTLVQIDGTYLGGMSGDAGAHAGWSMLAAIVETKRQPYFFKLVGPSSTVQGAAKPFEALIKGVTPSA